MKIESVSPETLIEELSYGNPPPEEKWFRRGDFDPTYGMSELRIGAARGWIELDSTHANSEDFRFRLTPKGRNVLAALSKLDV